MRTENDAQRIMGGAYTRETVLNRHPSTPNHREGCALYQVKGKYVYI